MCFWWKEEAESAALYIGRLQDIKELFLQELIKTHYDGSPDKQLLVESELGLGTIISPLDRYKETPGRDPGKKGSCLIFNHYKEYKFGA